MDHALLAPSSAFRIVKCFGSARMERLHPDDEDTIDKREGVAVHWGGEQVLEGGVIALGLVACNDVTLTQDMCDASELYGNTINARCNVGQIEETIRLPVLHPENWGTPDHWFFSSQYHTLYVDDLKYGHRFVDVYMNWQLINYAALILNSIGRFDDDSICVVFTICQPRSYHRDGPVRTWSTTLGELRPALAVLAHAFNAAMQPDVRVTPDAEACRDCSARYNCEGAMEAAYIGADMSYLSEPLNMSPEALSREYRMLTRAESFIKARREGIKDRVLQVIRRQQSVPYFTIDRKPGRTVWNDDAVASGLVDIAAAYGVDVVKGFDMITPAQAIKAHMPVDVVKLFSRTNSGSVELVEDDGTRAAQIFNQPE